MSAPPSSGRNPNDTTVVHIGHDELVIRQRYEVISIINDLLIGIWFVIGSVELLIRPTIRLVRRLHLQRFHPDAPATTDAAYDY